jgi:hypothetical protein
MVMKITSLVIVIMFLSLSLLAEEQELIEGTVKIEDKEISKTTDQEICSDDDPEDECEIIEEEVLEYEDTDIVITV